MNDVDFMYFNLWKIYDIRDLSQLEEICLWKIRMISRTFCLIRTLTFYDSKEKYLHKDSNPWQCIFFLILYLKWFRRFLQHLDGQVFSWFRFIFWLMQLDQYRLLQYYFMYLNLLGYVMIFSFFSIWKGYIFWWLLFYCFCSRCRV